MTVEEEIGALLTARGRWLAVAESCTGGWLGARITRVSGSSTYFLGGVIAYANAAKIRLLGVEARLIETAGAVSEAVAAQMAEGVRRAFGADIGVSTTGIAGPGGATSEKPVGLVFIGMADALGAAVRRCRFAGDRAAVRDGAAEAALGWLVERLREEGDAQ